ncbi:hypothetical protein BOX15_Mlig013452g3 [Macrostomum lignano]|uniref:Uncharacterized protein n=2 Tax=Macrostomum lignano TaxID=282301 RepID=A0A267ES19_9PLAT|nr:hypothetical protein BOX15_Mlig013452g1 [Macrostomum lignano]PAA81299.1 hypothetical protein BOX15_Mlig013452g3 [Macrostomum lignano]
MVAVSELFGRTSDGREVQKIVLRSPGGFEAHVLTYGAALQSLYCPSRNPCDPPTDVVLGYDTVQGYESCPCYFGFVVGRQPGRVKDAQFSLPGGDQPVSVTRNHGRHSLHGGERGLTRAVWNIDNLGEDSVTLSLLSKDGEDGYPGNLRVTVTYTVSNDNSLRLNYSAECDRPCPVSLTNHAYFNLSGHSSGDVSNHRVQLASSRLIELDAELLPTGRVLPVDGTPSDLRGAGRKLSDGINFDHIYVLDSASGQSVDDESAPAAGVAEELSSGRRLSCRTDQPVLVFYTGYYIDSVPGKGGCQYSRHAGLCFETQLYPDSLNHPEFPSSLLTPGSKYSQATVFKFDYAP